jgi:hypothetical protein
MTMKQCQPSWCIDNIIEGHSTGDVVGYRRQRQRHLGHQIARKRLLQNAKSHVSFTASSRSSKLINTNANNNGVLAYHRPGGGGDLYLTGESSQYSSCAILDGHEVILAASCHGDVDVLKLPRYHEDALNKKGAENLSITELASRLHLNDSSTSYSVSARYKLKSFQNGQAFAVGTPSGTLSIYATEHSSSWCKEHFPSSWRQRIRQQDHPVDVHNNNLQRSTQEWSPYITSGWETDALRNLRPVVEPFSFVDNDVVEAAAEEDWSIKPHNDALWDMRETPSSLLVLHAQQDFSGCARQLAVLDSRTLGTDDTVAAVDCKDKGNKRFQQGITATCFTSDVSFMAALARPVGNKKIDAVVQLWDLRKVDTFVEETKVVDPSIDRLSSSFGKHFLSYLTPSSASNGGQVMITSSTQSSHSSVQHFWFDLGAREVTITGTVNDSFVYQQNDNAPVFAVNSNQDIMACYETSPGRDSIRLYELPKSGSRIQRYLQGASSNNDRKATVPPQKRYRNESAVVNHKSKHPRREDSDESSSSETDSDDSSDDGGNDACSEPGEHGIPFIGHFRPKLTDSYGLSTHLSCLAINDYGSAIVGGSLDGDIFVWRGV